MGRSSNGFHEPCCVNTHPGGRATELQRLTLSVDSGYVEGDYFQLAVKGQRTSCLEWGASAQDVESALNSMSALTDFKLPLR